MSKELAEKLLDRIAVRLQETRELLRATTKTVPVESADELVALAGCAQALLNAKTASGKNATRTGDTPYSISLAKIRAKTGWHLETCHLFIAAVRDGFTGAESIGQCAELEHLLDVYDVFNAAQEAEFVDTKLRMK